MVWCDQKTHIAATLCSAMPMQESAYNRVPKCIQNSFKNHQDTVETAKNTIETFQTTKNNY